MKKLILLFIILFTTVITKAQFLNSIGITAGISAPKQHFYFYNPDEVLKKEFLFKPISLNASVFAEFFSHDYVRWVTEIQYNQKGSLDKLDDSTKYKNRLQYVCWNNYLKLRYEMYRIIPYVLIGPRLEYKIKQRMQSPPVTGDFLKLHVSAAFGAGVEFVSYGNIKFFVEGFYNPDINDGYIKPELHVKNINLELRVGLKYQFDSPTSCNTPTYTE